MSALLNDYARPTRRFVDTAGKWIATTVEEAKRPGLAWPGSSIQLNPSLESGGTH
jgi:hypothetical protein